MSRNETTVTSAETPSESEELVLVISSSAGVQVVPLRGQRMFVIGRDEDCDIRIDDASVSRRHAVLSLAPLTLEDLGSRNGSAAGDMKLGARQKTPIQVAQALHLGHSVAIVQHATRPANEVVGEVVLADPAMLELYSRLDTVAPSELTVLLLGETGVGKEIVALETHRRSGRTGPFLQLNCGALPESILEGELFGYEKGAFTGANQAKAGLFEAAHEGTLFLDEVGELPLATQTKLLRVLENREVLRLGARKPTRIDVRFIAATHRDLHAMVRQGTLREDLFFRLNGISLRIPPLRERLSEVIPLANAFLNRGKRKNLVLSQDTQDVLLAHGWRGNVRELRHAIERASVLAKGTVVEPEDLLLDADDQNPSGTLRTSMVSPSFVANATVAPPAPQTGEIPIAAPIPTLPVEDTGPLKRAIEEVLARTAGNQAQAARLLGISRYALLYRMKELGIPKNTGRLT